MYAITLSLSMIGYANAFPVVPMRIFVPHHNEVDDFGAPIHHDHMPSVLPYELFYNDMFDREEEFAKENNLHQFNNDHEPSAPVHDPSIRLDHAYYSHSYGIEPSVNAVELDFNSHQDRHHLAELAHESMFTHSKASHGFDHTMDFMDGIHHDHLHHRQHDHAIPQSHHSEHESLFEDHHHQQQQHHPLEYYSHHESDPHHVYYGHEANSHLYDRQHFPLEHHTDHISDPHSFDWFHHDNHHLGEDHYDHHELHKRDVGDESPTPVVHPNEKDEMVHKDAADLAQKNDTSSHANIALASTLLGSSPNPLATKIHHSTSVAPQTASESKQDVPVKRDLTSKRDHQNVFDHHHIF